MISNGPYSPRSPISTYSPMDKKVDKDCGSPDQDMGCKMARASVAPPTIAGIAPTFRSPVAKRSNVEEDDRGFAQFVRNLYEKQVLKKGMNGSPSATGSIDVNNSVGNIETVSTIKEVEEASGALGEDEDGVDLAEELGIDVDMYMQMGLNYTAAEDADIEVSKYKRIEIGNDINPGARNFTHEVTNTTSDGRAEDVDSYRQTNRGIMMLLPPPSFGADLNELAINYGANSSISNINDSSTREDHSVHDHNDYIDHNDPIFTSSLSSDSIGVAI